KDEKCRPGDRCIARGARQAHVASGLTGAMRRVAITGLGVVSALGVGVDAFWAGLSAGRSGTRRVTLVDPALLNTPIAAEVPDFDPEQLLAGAALDMLDRFSQLALVAGKEAVEDAGLVLNDEERDRTGVSIGTGIGGAGTQD